MGSSGFSWKLADHPKLPKGKLVAMIVLDGWGEASPDKFNCIHVAETPTMDSLKNGAPDKWRLVRAHGTAVGLPTEDDMGNSEVGHNALGAGRIFAQGAKLVDLALASGKIFEDEGFNYIKESFATNTLHLIGLMSDGGVHSRLDQLQLLLRGASQHGAKRIRVHVLTDGRDVLDGSSVGLLKHLNQNFQTCAVKALMHRLHLVEVVCMSPWTVTSETVKFGHVTFFWNGNRSGYFNSELEEYVEIPSDIGITFNVQPKMKALEIGEKARDAILSGKFDQVRVNIPNGDMVGHTGDVEATVVACKAADEAVKMIIDAVEQVGGIFVVTADHGNAEDMVKRNKKGAYCNWRAWVSCAGVKFRKDVPSGGLANVAATVMNLHGFVAPDDYETTLIEVVD
ncbi:hypothetical protein E3N88_45653 [Mikania micrantha]|uniref:phosphoglycerate mutase (2,3-diphosphoglycerate-independent) n=1 Tax=Mikania micrantha TaxID=192012 RepID=A0A5N6L8V0_9ASTR|nr:hypothetical protein E3N88_45653 [Mikania micrantha]